MTLSRDEILGVETYLKALQNKLASTLYPTWVEGVVSYYSDRGEVSAFCLESGAHSLSCTRIASTPELSLGATVLARIRPHFFSDTGSLSFWSEEEIIESVPENLSNALPHKTPVYPDAIGMLGIVASTRSEALGDAIAIVQKYAPHIETTLYPASMIQGVSGLSQALEHAHKDAEAGSIDALLITRGGGDAAQFALFNHQKVLDAIASFPCMVITGIGHACDRTLLDNIVEKSFYTPTEAALFVAKEGNF